MTIGIKCFSRQVKKSFYNINILNLGTFNSRHGTIERNSQMNKFLSVLGQREFLIPFVKTLEAQPNFTMTDRNNVAAFIMIALQDRNGSSSF